MWENVEPGSWSDPLLYGLILGDVVLLAWLCRNVVGTAWRDWRDRR